MTRPWSVQWVVLWDGRRWPGRILDGLPAFAFRGAPSGLLTRRQLRAAGLGPGGQEPYARLVWGRDRRWAWLYRADLARPKRIPSPAQLAALRKALAARRVCAVCGPVDHCVRTTDQLCGECHAAGRTPGGYLTPERSTAARWRYARGDTAAGAA
jgi:hypothetical protein